MQTACSWVESWIRETQVGDPLADTGKYPHNRPSSVRLITGLSAEGPVDSVLMSVGEEDSQFGVSFSDVGEVRPDSQFLRPFGPPGEHVIFGSAGFRSVGLAGCVQRSAEMMRESHSGGTAASTHGLLCG